MLYSAARSTGFERHREDDVVISTQKSSAPRTFQNRASNTARHTAPEISGGQHLGGQGNGSHHGGNYTGSQRPPRRKSSRPGPVVATSETASCMAAAIRWAPASSSQ